MSINHHALIITAYRDRDIKKAHKKALEIFGNQVSGLVASKINNFQSFFIGPDGSKEGWPISDEGEENTREYIEWLKSQKDMDVYLAYAKYGDEESQWNILSSHCHCRRLSRLQCRLSG